MHKIHNSDPMKKPMLRGGKLFFTKETERRILFFMTLILLAYGAVMKLL